MWSRTRIRKTRKELQKKYKINIERSQNRRFLNFVKKFERDASIVGSHLGVDRGPKKKRNIL